MSETIKTVKTEFTADTKKAVSAISALISKTKELKSQTDRSKTAKVGEEARASAKEAVSAYDAHIKKIAQLTTALKSVQSEYNNIVKKAYEVEAAGKKWDFKTSELRFNPKNEKSAETARQWSEEYSHLQDQVKQLNSAAEALKETLQSFGVDLSNGLTQEAITEFAIKAKMAIKEEEQALKELGQAEKETSNSAKSTASSHISMATAAKRLSQVFKGIKSVVNGVSKVFHKLGAVAKSIGGKIKSAFSGIKNLASSIKGAIPHTKNFGGAIGKLASQFKRLFVLKILRTIIANIIKGFKEGIQNIAQYSAALNNMDSGHANQTMSELASTAQYLKNTLGAAVIPMINAVLPLIRQLATAFATGVNYVNQFFAALTGKTTWTRAKQSTVDYASSLGDVGSSAGSAKEAVEDLQRTILGFDEINKLNDASGSSGSGGSGGGGGSDSVSFNDMFEEVPIDNEVTDFLDKIKAKVDELRDPYLNNIVEGWNHIKDAVKSFVNSDGFKMVVDTVLKMALEGIATAEELVADGFETIENTLGNSKIHKLIRDIAEAWTEVQDAVKKLVESPGFQKFATGAFELALKGVKDILLLIKEGVTLIDDELNRTGIQVKATKIKDAWDDVKSAIANLVKSDGFKKLVDLATYTALDTLERVLKTLSGLIGGIQKALDDLEGDNALDNLASAWSGFTGAISDLFNSPGFQDFGSTILGMAVYALTSALESIKGIIENVVIPAFNELSENGTLEDISDSWGQIWDSIKHITESKLFQDLVSGALKGAIEGIGGAIKGIAGALEIIEGIFSLDFDKVGQGLRDFVSGILGMLAPIWETIDKIAGTDLAKQNKAIQKSIEENISYDDAWDSLYNPDKNKYAPKSTIENESGENWFMQASNGLYIYNMSRDDFRTTLADWKKEVWDKVPVEDRMLEFEAFISEHGAEYAAYSIVKPWENISEEEKQLAFEAYVASLPEDVAKQYADQSWYTMSDNQRMLAWAALIATPGATVAGRFLKSEWETLTDTQKQVAFNAWLETSGKTLAEAYKSEEWAMISDKDRELLFGAGVEKDAPKNVRDSVEKGFNKLDRDLEFKATTGRDAPQQLLEGFVNPFNRLNRDLNFNAKTANTPSQLNQGFISGFNNLSAESKALKYTSTNTTPPETIRSAFINAFNGLSGRVMNYSSANTTSAESLRSAFINTYNGLSGTKVLKFSSTNTTSAETLRAGIIDTFNGFSENQKRLIFGSTFKTGSAGDATNTNSLWGMWNKLTNFMGGKYASIQGEWGSNKLYALWVDLTSYMWRDPFAVRAEITSLSVGGGVSTYITATPVSKFTGGIIGKAMGGLVSAASGRFIDSAQMFLARENGIPEYVGRFGSHSAVANNYQITTGIAMGVEQAMMGQNALLQEQNRLLTQIATSGTTVNVASLLNSANRVNKRTGQPVITMG